MTMPTQQAPFFASFFGAFRARTIPTFQAKSSTASTSLSTSIATNAHLSTVNSGAGLSTARTITTASTSETSSFNQHQQTTNSNSMSSPTANKATTTFTPSAFTSTSPGTHSPFYSSRSPGTSSPTGNSYAQGIPLTRGRQRRGSDSSNSSGGFMEALGSGSEKWYIGGRTAGGDERFYRLGLVTAGGTGGSGRATSLDRLSL